jgi:CubicO group peptidase (beta-lactamase class C family)
MRRAVIVLATAVVLLARAPARADDLVLRLFGDYLDALRIQAGIPGLSAAIVGDNDIIWERAFGQQEIARSIATKSDTPFQVDGLTQVFAAAMVLRCVEEGRLSLDDRIGQFKPDSSDATATLRQILTHTSGPSDSLAFAYRPERFAPLTIAVRQCTGDSFRETLANLLERLAMNDSVPGADVIHIAPPAEGIPSPAAVDRYTGVLARLATPYAVDKEGHASPSQYAATTITPASGLISTTRDLAKFDVALTKGILLRADTLAAAWQPPIGRNGQALPHGIGWFVQRYNGEPIVWQFGVGENASSSLVVKAPGRGLTLIVLANGDGLVKPLPLAAGDVTLSPVGRLFLGTFIR